MSKTKEYGVFVWRADGKYKQSESVANFVTEKSAQKHADKLNAKGGNYVPRVLRYYPNPARKSNPGKMVELAQAAKLYENFTGHEGETIAKIRKPKIPKAVAVIGECDGILYSTVRDGKLEKYIHKFKKSARPLFCISPDGKQILLLGGEYEFTERGIIDQT